LSYPLILSVYPRHLSTDVALFRGPVRVFVSSRSHRREELVRFVRVRDQLPIRIRAVEDVAVEHSLDLSSVEAFVACGGLVGPVRGGFYRVDRAMEEVLGDGTFGEHVYNLGGLMVHRLSRSYGGVPLVGDPVSTFELCPEARLSGMVGCHREPVFHALSQRSAARFAAGRLGRAYRDCRLVVAHLGYGISVGAHLDGLVVEVNDALHGEGPFSLERAGSLPTLGLLELAYSGRHDMEDLRGMITRDGGLARHLGCRDFMGVEALVRRGDQRALEVFDAFVSGISKEIAARATVLRGEVDAVVLTGPMVAWDRLVSQLEDRCGWIAPVITVKGQDELADLAMGALEVLSGRVEPLVLGDR